LLKAGADPQTAVEEAVALLAAKTGGTGGLILIDSQGKIGYARNTTYMPVCWATPPGRIELHS
jgi:isoaspartyl peptidase/L-asparaginase-like protein (Ntn-hydrolase superfamily)